MIKIRMYSTNPSKEKKFYVYFHRDLSGNIFYVGERLRRRVEKLRGSLKESSSA